MISKATDLDFIEEPSIRELFDVTQRETVAYFDGAESVLLHLPRGSGWCEPESKKRDRFWSELPAPLRNDALGISQRLLPLMGRISSAVKNASLASDADQRDVTVATKAMRAALLLRKFKSWEIEILHNEGDLLGVQPPGQSDDGPSPPEEARLQFESWADKVEAIIDLVIASGRLESPSDINKGQASRYRPNTAFIMMAMSKAKPELTDVADTVKGVFELFGVRAVRADDIEHEGLITEKILDEIKTAEFCFADLTGERPNVYYEVGYAHALGRRVILYRLKNTGLHFDLAGYNCPEYANLHELRELLTRRMVQLTNRKPKN